MLDRPPSVEREPRFAASAPKTLFNVKRESRPNPWDLSKQCTEITNCPPVPHNDLSFLTTAQNHTNAFTFQKLAKISKTLGMKWWFS